MTDRKPDHSGVASAWKMEFGDYARPEQAATLNGYVINGPYHPFWKWWMVAVIHLREIDGVPSANKQYPEAEYEFMILSIDPERNQPDPDKPFPQDVGYLQPPDCVVQFHGVTDEQAAEICQMSARAISMGQSCDSDFRSWWESAIKNSVKHVRGEPH
jgi:hypothetical protein